LLGLKSLLGCSGAYEKALELDKSGGKGEESEEEVESGVMRWRQQLQEKAVKDT
jgi:hypothetical protein